MPPGNVLVAMTDDHGQWCAGPYGNEDVRTPTMDHLAATGTRFENAFCPTPVCSPARASFFTGRRASQHGVHDWISSGSEFAESAPLSDEVLLPELLSEAGYETAIAGKWHCGPDRDREAFDHVYSVLEGGWSGSTHSLERDRRITDNAISFLRDTWDRDRPFFLFVGYVGTHAGWYGEPERLVEPYRGSAFGDVPDDPTYQFGRTDVMNVHRPGDPDPQEARAQYYAAVQGIDEQLGRLVDELGAAGIDDETLVAYTADHGHNCGHHNFWGKGNGTRPQNLLEESIRVPLIVSGHDDVYRDQVRDEFVDHCDLFETLLEFAGADRPTDRSYPGRSVLSPILDADGRIEHPYRQFLEYGDVRGIRTDRYKFVERHFDAPDLLFDLDADPRETRNRIEDDDYASVRERLAATLSAEFEEQTDPTLDGTRIEALPRYNGSEAWADRLESC